MTPKEKQEIKDEVNEIRNNISRVIGYLERCTDMEA